MCKNKYLLYILLFLIEIPLMIGSAIPVTMLVAEMFILGLLLLSYCWKRDAGDAAELLSIFADRRLFYFLLGYMTIFWPVLAIVKYYSFQFHLFDTGNFANILAKLVNTGHFYSTVLELNALADHFSPNLMLFYPLFSWKMTFLWLTGFKILSYLTTALLLIRLGKLLIGADSKAVYIAPVLFLFNMLISRTLNFEFQPSALALPFIVLGFIYALEKKYIPMALTLVFMVGFKEHLPLVWISLGIFLILYRQQQRKAGILLIVAGALMGLLIFFVAMPYFNDGIATSQSGKFGPFSLLPEKLGLLVLAFTTVGFLPLFSTRSLLFILPAFAISWMSNVPNMVTIHFHYLDMPAVILFIGVTCGIAEMKKGTDWLKRIHPRASACVLSACFLMIIAANTYFPTRGIREHWPERKHLEMHSEVQLLKTLVDGCNLWTVEKVGVLYFEYPNLKSINMRDIQSVMHDPACHWIVLTSSPDNSGLSEAQYNELKSWVLKKEEQGDYQGLSGFTHFMVFRTTHPKNGTKNFTAG